MSMIQIIIGTACGFLLAQAGLHGLGRLAVGLRRGALWERVRTLSGRMPRLPGLRGPTVLGAFIKYAAPVGTGIAVATLCVWGINDYLAARSARKAEASLFDSSAAAGDSGPGAPAPQSAALTPPEPPQALAEPVAAVDPYTDPQFRVQRRARGSGDALREALLQKSEARARGELLLELRQHARRSQYDCEAAARGDRYLKAGLDVWGFMSWQVKYFPVDAYRGATLEQCRGIKSIVASPVDLQSAVAQQNPDDAEQR